MVTAVDESRKRLWNMAKLACAEGTTSDRIDRMIGLMIGPDTPPELLAALQRPDVLADWACEQPPSPATLATLSAVPPRTLGRRGRLDALAALEAQLGWLQAAQLRLIATIADQDNTVDPARDWVREEVAAALGLSPESAGERLHLARQLTRRFPDTLTAMAAGRLGLNHARALLELTAKLDDAQASAVEARVLPEQRPISHSAFRRAVRRAVAALDTRAAERRHQHALAQRCVQLTPAADGMAHLWALLPADAAASLAAAIDHLAAHTDPTDARTAEQRRADALLTLTLGHPGTNRPAAAARGSCGQAGPAVQVTVALSTLLGTDDQPGELAGHGPVPAALARRLAADPTGTWRRLLTDDTGRLLHVGRRAYRPPADLTRHVIARDQSCRFPGCQRPAHRCELDHLQPFSLGGATDQANLHALCRRHHHLKHDAGWAVTRTEDGTTEWPSPTGKTSSKPPEPLPVDRTVRADLPPPF